ncbi:MAG TPA: PepSY-associated TM helix domain-containing protein [Hyphomicrobiales bacterium]|nr:PepSY-associated TM helix domain-containing protein [Hyphomicrobiales bacterium]
MNPKFVSISRTIHVYLSIALLLALVFFAITGITLNNATLMTGQPSTSSETLDTLPDLPRDADGRIIESEPLKRFLRERFGVRLDRAVLSYEDEILVVDYQAPGRMVLVEIDQELGEAFVESTDFGLVAFLNDLHKGRNVDLLWDWLIDISGVLLVIFSLAGLVLLLPNKRRFRKVLRYSAVGLVLLSVGYLLGNL